MVPLDVLEEVLPPPPEATIKKSPNRTSTIRTKDFNARLTPWILWYGGKPVLEVKIILLVSSR